MVLSQARKDTASLRVAVDTGLAQVTGLGKQLKLY